MSTTTDSGISRKNTFSSKMKKLFGSTKSTNASTNSVATTATATTTTPTPVGTNTKIHNIYNNKNVNRSSDDYNNLKSMNSNSPTNSQSSDFSLSKKIDRASKGSSSSSSSLDRDSIGSELSTQHISGNESTNPLSPMRSLQNSIVTSTTAQQNSLQSRNDKQTALHINTTQTNPSEIKKDTISSTTTTAVPQTPTTNNAANCKRFIVLENGSHEHHLKAAKRQEKLTSMLKNMMGSQKTRGDAISAVPDIISISSVPATPISAINTNNTITTNNGIVRNMDPPTLMSGLIRRLESKDKLSGSTNSATSTLLDGGAVMPVMSGNTDKTSLRSTSNEITVTTSNSNNPSKRNVCERFADKYGKCIEVAGRGAFGTVRICHKKSNNKKEGETLFAVKEFLKKNNESAERYKKRLTAEYCISSSLHHTNIVGTIDLLKDSKGDFLQVMEYCPGGDLFSLIIAAGRLEYLEADCFFKQLIKGVVYMHDMGVCHRDLKPENLLLTADGVIKITDFGNSECFKMAWERDIHLSGGVCGSSPYIAPEEYVQEEFDPRAIDIWSCGVIYMAMRTGRQLWSIAMKEDPFYCKYLKGRKEKGGYKPLEQLKRARCRNVIYSMLDPCPSRRITGKQILNSEWGREIKCCHESRAIKV